MDNSSTITDFLNSNNFEGGRKTISTYDFQTLYTHIPHGQLTDNLKKFVEQVYETKKKKYICVTSKAAFFSDKQQNKYHCFTKVEFISSLSFLVENSYVVFKGNLFRQIIGIPMGTNSAPHMANIYLFQYEYEYIQQLKGNNKIKELRLLQSIYRYQDDLLVVNDNSLFDSIFQDIYPREMVLKKTNVSSAVVNFLDSTISVYQGKFLYKLYDKRDDFDFTVLNYPHACGNIPSAPTHGIFISQIIRFSNMNSSYKNYIQVCKKLYEKLILQRFSKSCLQRKFDDFCARHILCWSKFGVDIQNYKTVICS